MIAGIDKYFESIQVQRSTLGTDSMGSPSEIWANHSVIQGRIRQLNGKEINEQKDIGVSSHRLYTRSPLLITDRIVYKSQTYTIIRVNNVMNFDELYQVDLWLVNS